MKQALRTMQRQIGRPVSEAQRSSLRPVLKAAKQNLDSLDANVTGELKKSLTIKKDAKAPKTKPTYKVGPRSDSPAVRYAHLVEFGTDPHNLPNGGKHPGTSPKPFLTMAFETEGKTVIKKFGEEIGKAVEKQAVRLARKAAK